MGGSMKRMRTAYTIQMASFLWLAKYAAERKANQ